LFERIKIERKPDSDGPARSFEDYQITIDETDLGKVQLLRKIA